LEETNEDSDPRIAAAINESGPFAGFPNPKFLVTGPLVDEALEFTSVEEATAAVEEIVVDSGGTIKD
jgi:hypothetical protein